MFAKNILLTFLSIGALTVLSVNGGSIDIEDGTYVLHWTVSENDLEVEATVRGIGYVGFGIAPNRSMTGADIFVSGVNTEDQTTYHWDMHGVSNNVPIKDDEDNYELISATETEEYTTVKFRRPLISPDKTHDLDILNSIQFIEWAVGSNDDLEYHFSNRGILELNLLADPERK